MHGAHRTDGGWTEWATIIAGIGAAVVAAGGLVWGYFVQQRRSSRERRAQIYGEAIRAVEDYLEAPFRIMRKDGTAAVRRSLTESISTTQSQIAYYQALLRVHAPESISALYDDFVTAARREAGPAMTSAWSSKPTRRGRDVPLGARFDRTHSDAALDLLVEEMRRDVGR